MKVLIVDDTIPLREQVSKAIEGTYDIHIVGEECKSDKAVEFVRETKPDVAILDFKIPSNDSIKIIQKLKEDNPLMKIVIFTNYPFLQYQKKCVEAGADYFLTKWDEGTKITNVLRELRYKVGIDLTIE